jgi:RNA polymerase sigma factor (sigma-70 family)
MVYKDDQEILFRFKDPSTRESAFTELMKKFQEKIYWHIRRMVIDHEDSNDLLQNVFIKVWKSLDDFRQESQLYTWVYRIATNECLSFLEQKKKRAAISIESGEGFLTERIKAERNFDNGKPEWKLQLAIQELPEKQRIVFHLRYYDEMPYGEMSKILETSEGALKASYHHAVKKIENYILNH